MDLRRSSARKPLLRDNPALRANSLASDLDPGSFEDEPAPRQEACAGAGEVVVAAGIDLSPTAMTACRAAVPACNGQGQPKAAPHCHVHEVGREGRCCIGKDGRKPHTRMGTGLGVKEGTS